MMSSNITSSGNKVIDTATLTKTSVGRTVEPKQSPPAEATAPPAAAAVVEAPEVAAEVRKSPEKIAPPSEEVDQAMREKVKEAVANVRDFIKKNQRTLDFEMAEESNRVIITVIDRETNKVIRQIPPEDVVNISEQIANGELPSPDGMLFKVKA